MTINIGDALSRGFDDLTSGRGVAVLGLNLAYLLGVAFVGLTLLSSIVDWAIANTDSTREEFFAQSPGLEEVLAFAPDVSLAVAGVLFVLALLVGVVVNIVSIRIFASDSAETIPTEEVTRRLGRTILFQILAGILVGIIVAFGFVLLIIPCIVLGFLLFFTQYAVVIDDAGPVEALKKSYGVVTDSPIEVLVLVIALIALSIVVSLPFSLLPVGEPAGAILSNLVSMVVNVFTVATLTDAYLQGTGQRGETV